MKIAILITCHNRKNKTLSCINHIYEALCFYNHKNSQGVIIQLSIFLTDDGSTDGTSEEVFKKYPEVIILKGTGKMFWAGGMRNSWNESLKIGFDAYFLINDDTRVLLTVFNDLLDVHNYSIQEFGSGGIYIGSTKDLNNNITYGGSIIKSKFFNTYKRLVPDGSIKSCDYGNSNIMLVNNDVINKIGIFSNEYTHGLADYDYTLTAKKNKIPVLLARNFCGICLNDNYDKYEIYKSLTFNERINFLFHPKGFAFADQIKYMRKFFPFRLPLVLFGAFVKLGFPKLYNLLNKIR